VQPEFREQGIGTELCRHAVKKCPTKKLYLISSNEVAQKMYESCGFQEIRTAPDVIAARRAEVDAKFPAGTPRRKTMMVETGTKQMDASFSAKPDLVILDGGKGQLSTVLKNVKFPKTTTVVGLAKREEEIFTATADEKGKFKFEKIVLPKNSNSLHLVQRLRDEAHRFANSLREKIQKKNMLEK